MSFDHGAPLRSPIQTQFATTLTPCILKIGWCHPGTSPRKSITMNHAMIIMKSPAIPITTALMVAISFPHRRLAVAKREDGDYHGAHELQHDVQSDLCRLIVTACSMCLALTSNPLPLTRLALSCAFQCLAVPTERLQH